MTTTQPTSPQPDRQPQDTERAIRYPAHLWLTENTNHLHTMWNLHRIYDPRA
ncbi:hypothetical protein [Tumebacillus flagellatus]|uniref:hypothetical protein n=1 Tax=Tumebacillus flagellatus TaxID=1157490 RepID=UPI001376C2BA|nr:hypothetical protein [Tumebacillus flagellatus]